MKGMIIVFVLSFFVSIPSTASVYFYKAHSLPVQTIMTDRINERLIAREIREFTRFRKLVDRYILQSEKGARISARRTLRRLHVMMRSELNQSRIKYRAELEQYSRNSRRRSGLYRRPVSPLSKRSLNDRTHRASVGVLDLYRFQMQQQDHLADQIRLSLDLRRIREPEISEALFAFENTLRAEIEWMTGDPRPAERAILRARPADRGRR